MPHITIKPRKIILDKKYQEYSYLLPEHEVETVTITAKCESCVMNAIRRTLIGELRIYALHAHINNIVSTGFIPKDEIANRLLRIPISQKYPNLIGSLHVENNTSEERLVTTKDIIFKNDNIILKPSDILDTTYRLERLKPKQALYVNDISCSLQAGYDKQGESTMVSNTKWSEENSVYTFKFDTLGNVTAKELLKITLDNIISRLENVLEFVKESNGKTTMSQLIDITFSNDPKICNELFLKNETYTIAELIRRMTYLCDVTIECINYSQTSPLNHEILIKWIHSSSHEIIIAGLKRAIQEVQRVLQ